MATYLNASRFVVIVAALAMVILAMTPRTASALSIFPVIKNQELTIPGPFGDTHVVQPVAHYAYDLSPAQINSLGNSISQIIQSVVDVPLRIIEGVFQFFADASGDFHIEQHAVSTDQFQLVFTPPFPITEPGLYGDISYSFLVDSGDFGNAKFVNFTAVGPLGQETISLAVSQVPEPATILLFFSGLLAMAARLRFRVTSQSEAA